MDTAKELRRTVEDISDELAAQHGTETPYCEILHFELNLPQTRRDDWEKMMERFKKNEVDIDEDSIKLTTEHDQLHETLRRFVVDSMSQGMDAAQLAAQMLAVGRRLGLAEAAAMLGEEH